MDLKSDGVIVTEEADPSAITWCGVSVLAGPFASATGAEGVCAAAVVEKSPADEASALGRVGAGALAVAARAVPVAGEASALAAVAEVDVETLSVRAVLERWRCLMEGR
ncbi:hypothetical protein [Actinomadura harenae]|uniref:hypothetical protein n=1 Tax=Actinomadura harenae TaxID=2483351 RepID=UPI001F3851F5|nr:hypothetical protein [Actinomadura harenae]